jgi:hypothetical protein
VVRRLASELTSAAQCNGERLAVVALHADVLSCCAHSWTHLEGWRDWPVETPATSRKGRCQFLTDVVEVSYLRHLKAEVF